MLIGGSVASQLAQNQAPPAPRYLEEELNKKYVSPNGKPWLVLNGGDGAWKEPQPFILFSLYATSVDAMVSLGGFNEHYFFRPYATRAAGSARLSNFLEVNPFVADENFGDAAIGWVMGRHRRHAGAQSRPGPFARRLPDHPRHRGGGQGQGQLQVEQEDDDRQHVRLAGGDPPRCRSRLSPCSSASIRSTARAEEVVAHDNNVKTAYFFQPVPAFGKTLTEEEKRVVGDLSYGDLYRRIVAGMMTLRERGLAMYDLGDIFAEREGHDLRRPHPLLAGRRRREPRQSADGGPDRRVACRNLGPAEEALTGRCPRSVFP